MVYYRSSSPKIKRAIRHSNADCWKSKVSTTSPQVCKLSIWHRGRLLIWSTPLPRRNDWGFITLVAGAQESYNRNHTYQEEKDSFIEFFHMILFLWTPQRRCFVQFYFYFSKWSPFTSLKSVSYRVLFWLQKSLSLEKGTSILLSLLKQRLLYLSPLGIQEKSEKTLIPIKRLFLVRNFLSSAKIYLVNCSKWGKD